MKRIAIITATRAEYGLLKPLIQRVDSDDELELDLIVTGGHLSEEQGMTVWEIEDDGFEISHRIPILDEDNSPYGVSLAMARAIRGFAGCFRKDRPDLAVILGDRTEMLGVASAAMNERIPIAHIHGGEVTEGAVDDCIRHSLTKMSYLHFVSTDIYRRRVIQMGENPERVYNVGALSVENIKNISLIPESELRRVLEIGDEYKDRPLVVTTFHPVTVEHDTAEFQVKELCKAIDERSDFFYLITKANTDTGGDKINRVLEEYVFNKDNTKLVSSLGTKRYLSAVKCAAFVLGNSSSGIGEAPILGTPTVNIGDRQKGRLMAETILCCEPQVESIVKTMDEAKKREHVCTDMYGEGDTSTKIVSNIKKELYENHIDLKKGFYDLSEGAL